MALQLAHSSQKVMIIIAIQQNIPIKMQLWGERMGGKLSHIYAYTFYMSKLLDCEMMCFYDVILRNIFDLFVFPDGI